MANSLAVFAPPSSPPPLPRRVALVVLTGRTGPMSGEAQNVGVAPLCAHGLRVESARRWRVSGVGGGSDGRHARLWRRRGRAGRLCTSHSPPVSRGSPRTSRSGSFALRNQAALQIRAGGARWPSNYGRRRRPIALVSCRFGVEIGARSVTWSHHEPAMPSVYLGEPPEAPLGRVRHPVRIRFGPGTLRPNQI